jgi:hypothetical protein
MRNARAIKSPSPVEPTPLELIEIAKGIPFNEKELVLAWESLALTQETAKAWERIADLLRDKAHDRAALLADRSKGMRRPGELSV